MCRRHTDRCGQPTPLLSRRGSTRLGRRESDPRPSAKLSPRSSVSLRVWPVHLQSAPSDPALVSSPGIRTGRARSLDGSRPSSDWRPTFSPTRPLARVGEWVDDSVRQERARAGGRAGEPCNTRSGPRDRRPGPRVWSEERDKHERRTRAARRRAGGVGTLTCDPVPNRSLEAPRAPGASGRVSGRNLVGLDR